MNLEFELNIRLKNIVEKYIYHLFDLKTKHYICAELNRFIKDHERFNLIDYRQKIQFLVRNDVIVIDYYSSNDFYQTLHTNYVENVEYPGYLNFELPIEL